jgi:hypothetical protein
MSNEYKDWLRDEQVDRLLAEIEKAKPVLDAAVKWQLSDVKDPQLTDDVYGLYAAISKLIERNLIKEKHMNCKEEMNKLKCRLRENIQNPGQLVGICR